VLKTHPLVTDAVVVGLPDERWGEAVTGLVQAEPGRVDEAALREHVHARLAAYKCPRAIELVEESKAGLPDPDPVHRSMILPDRILQ